MNVACKMSVEVGGDAGEAVADGLQMAEACELRQDSVEAISVAYLSLPGAGDAQEVCAAGVSLARALFVRVNGTALLTLDNGIELTLEPMPASDKAAMLVTSSFRKATLRAVGTADLKALCMLWGDEQKDEPTP